jgi:hypothetical protein
VAGAFAHSDRRGPGAEHRHDGAGNHELELAPGYALVLATPKAGTQPAMARALAHSKQTIS